MEALMKNSTEIYDGLTVTNGFFTWDVKVGKNETKERCGKYCINNGVVAFYCAGKLFVTKIIEGVIDTLKSNGFTFDNFYVPLSNGDWVAEK